MHRTINCQWGPKSKPWDENHKHKSKDFFKQKLSQTNTFVIKLTK